ncbi:MAG: NAD(P)-binding domain-containing protein, partial [bacterium]
MKNQCDIGVFGLAVMGQNLVLNIESKGFKVAVYNRTTETAEKFIEQRAENKNIYLAYEIKEFINLLSRPRKVMLMVKAGKAVDYVLESLLPHLEEGDIVIDGGNSHFADTNRRYEELAEKGIKYLGTGISGGEYGALHGPSIMPGGDRAAYDEVAEIFEAVAAKSKHGSCVTYLGEKSAGHYVKMVHNGIEYGVMQLIAEIYDFMRKVMDLSTEEMSKVFEEWNEYHQSYLMENTYKILKRIDPETEKPLVDVILDEAKQKGT